ncbi:reverse transcriptase [Elysia marginata]|uniref:Reverse transcriptase n=1 Tax=Elysia marginata TaxID=1093978 RepID=A0AAV4JJL8_9GAST|nr:reverse transcriptase [Elysia marginata]
MYCRKAKLKLPMKSVLEEYRPKCEKVRLVAMLEDSDYPVGKTVQPSIKTDRKWKVAEAFDEAKECLKMKEGGARSNTSSTQRKELLDGCDDWEVSADLPEWDKHADVIRRTTIIKARHCDPFTFNTTVNHGGTDGTI